MKIKPTKDQITWGIVAFLTVAACIFFYFLLFHGGRIATGFSKIYNAMMSIVVGIIIAYIISPIVNFIEKKILMPILQRRGIKFENEIYDSRRKTMRKYSVLISFILVALILYALIALIVPQLIKSIEEIVGGVPNYVRNVNKFINTYLDSQPDIANYLNNTLNSATSKFDNYIDNSIVPNMSEIIQDVSKRFVSFVKGIFNLIVGIIVAIYLLNSKEILCAQAKKMAYAFFKEGIANELVGSFRFVHYTFIGFITGKLVDSIIIGFLCYFGCLIFKIPYPILLGVFVGITNVIPFFGPYIGGITGSILLVLINPISALIFLIFVIVLQQFDGNILGPKILGNSTGLSSFWVIFAIMLFGGVFGIVGWVIGVPVFAVFYAFVRRITNHYLTARKITTDTTEFTDLAYIENGTVEPLSDEENQKFHSQKPVSSWRKIFNLKRKSHK